MSVDNGLQSPVGMTFGGEIHTIQFSDEFVHGLIGGRTGSGKTVLLHNLICGLAQEHDFQDLELYLLDFSGTEFNVYSRNRLPHARIIAVDCDPEVGLAAIRKLVEEMEQRTRLFDQEEVSNIRECRRKGRRLSRILLIIDEIQVLTQLNSDAKTKRAVENGLIDLLKRGRKYGIHVLLGTQTPTEVLSGSMLQQIAIRICMLSDHQVSRLVLGENNEAAAALQKTGEAVYNAYNGRADKNVLVRAALLEQSHVADIVKRLCEKADARTEITRPLAKYFDGKTRGRLKDSAVNKLVLESSRRPATSTITVPLGTAIEFKEDTAVVFAKERYNGNLILVGSDGESLHALLKDVLLGLSIQCPVDSSSLFLIDLCSEDYSYANALQTIRAVLPRETQFARNSSLGTELVQTVYDEFKERAEAGKTGKKFDHSIFLVVFGMENFADMRGPDKFTKTPTRQKLEEIMKDGARLGIHVVVATQTLAKGEIITADEFGWRVCFQVSEDDSRALIEDDAGSKITRRDRAIMRRRDWGYGKVERFKPFAPSTDEEIQLIAQRLSLFDQGN